MGNEDAKLDPRGAKEGDFVWGFKLGGSGEDKMKVSHLLFPDDTIILFFYFYANQEHLG